MTRCRNCGVMVSSGWPLCVRCYHWRRHLAALRQQDIVGMAHALRRLTALGEWATVQQLHNSGNRSRA